MRYILIVAAVVVGASFVMAQSTSRPTTRIASSQPATSTSQPASQPAARKVFKKDSLEARTECASHLKQLAMIVQLASNMRPDGKLSPDLKTLLLDADIMLSPDVYICPDSTTPLPANWNGMNMDAQVAWVVAHTDYDYLGGGASAASDKGGQILLFAEKKPAHGGHHAVYADGHFAFITANVLPDAKKKSDAAKKAM